MEKSKKELDECPLDSRCEYFKESCEHPKGPKVYTNTCWHRKVDYHVNKNIVNTDFMDFAEYR